MLQWQEKGSHGKECASGQRPADGSVSQRNRWRARPRQADCRCHTVSAAGWQPAGSRLLQDLGFMAFTLPDVEILMPMKKPQGQRLTPDQQRVNRSLNERRLRIG